MSNSNADSKNLQFPDIEDFTNIRLNKSKSDSHVKYSNDRISKILAKHYIFNEDTFPTYSSSLNKKQNNDNNGKRRSIKIHNVHDVDEANKNENDKANKNKNDKTKDDESTDNNDNNDNNATLTKSVSCKY